MALTAGNIVDRAETILQDTTNIRWQSTELLQWLNDAQRQIVLLKPDANPVVESVLLTVGTKQTIPSTGTQFIDMTRNMGASPGTTPGAAITYIRRNILDEQNPSWHSTTASATVQHFTFDNRSPKVFYVYPPSVGTSYAEIHYANAPTDCLTGSNLALGDVYANPILDYILYRAYSKDADYAANEQRAAGALKRFYEALSLKSTAEDAFDPDRPPQARVVQSNQ
jgi:hypothetical protein